MLILIDNYDSFTWNLYHYLVELGGDVVVIRNDEKTVDEIMTMNPSHLVISPGPCDPPQAGISMNLVKRAVKTQTPLLGVCLGHQSIAASLGGTVIRTPPMHGKVSSITHNGQGIFKDIPSPFTITRYHSLVVEKVPEDIVITATAEDGTIQALAHKTLPIYGVQFHPESIASEYGHQLLKNFVTARNEMTKQSR